MTNFWICGQTFPSSYSGSFWLSQIRKFVKFSLGREGGGEVKGGWNLVEQKDGTATRVAQKEYKVGETETPSDPSPLPPPPPPLLRASPLQGLVSNTFRAQHKSHDLLEVCTC